MRRYCTCTHRVNNYESYLDRIRFHLHHSRNLFVCRSGIAVECICRWCSEIVPDCNCSQLADNHPHHSNRRNRYRHRIYIRCECIFGKCMEIHLLDKPVILRLKIWQIVFFCCCCIVILVFTAIDFIRSVRTVDLSIAFPTQ